MKIFQEQQNIERNIEFATLWTQQNKMQWNGKWVLQKSNFYLSILKKSQNKNKNQIFIAQGFEKKIQ